MRSKVPIANVSVLPVHVFRFSSTLLGNTPHWRSRRRRSRASAPGRKTPGIRSFWGTGTQAPAKQTWCGCPARAAEEDTSDYLAPVHYL